jgi:putative transposase
VLRVSFGKFFVSILVEDESQIPDPVPETLDRAVGVDLNLHDFAVLSAGEKVPHPQWLEPELRRLKILQRRLAKKAKGSRHREKIRRQIAHLHERVANRWQDFLPKLSTDLLRRFDTVCIEGRCQPRRTRQRHAYADASQRYLVSLIVGYNDAEADSP